MDTLTSMRVFVAVAARGSFSAAAQAMSLSPAMATKHIAQLEARLGVRLFHRTTRRVTLTEAGRQYLAHCQDGLDAIDAAEASVSAASDHPRGTLKVTAPVWFANGQMARRFAEYQQRYPAVVLDLQLENRRVDLVRDSYDLALRVTADPSPSMIVRPLCTVSFFLVASPSLYPGGRPPITVAQLDGARAVLPSYVALEAIELESPTGRETLHLNAGLYCNDTTLARHAALAGMGVAYLPAWLVEADIASGRLIHLLPDHRRPPLTLYAAYSSRRYMTSKVRTFIDFLSETLGDTEKSLLGV